MKPGGESERFRLAVEAGADITQALVREDAPTIIARRVAEVLDAWECDLYEYDPETRTLTVGRHLGARAQRAGHWPGWGRT